MVGRVCPRHGYRGRPLNSIVRPTVRFVFAVLIISAAFEAGAVASDASLPTFEQFPANPSSAHAPAKVRLDSHPKARRFRTVLREGAAAGPNFAGRYTIITWGCGTACQEVGIIDATNGQVFFPRQLQPNAYDAVTDETPPFQYRLDSRLLIVAGSPLDRADNIGIHYFVWGGRSLKEVLYVPKEWQR